MDVNVILLSKIYYEEKFSYVGNYKNPGLFRSFAIFHICLVDCLPVVGLIESKLFKWV